MLSLILISILLSQASAIQTNDCPEGWEPLYGKCYLIATGKPTTWSLAQQDCQNNGAELVLPLDKAENDGVYDLYEKRVNNVKKFWIDAVALDETQPLKYTTRDGCQLNYTNWLSGSNPQPNDANGCVFVGTGLGKPGLWADDSSCQKNYDYICVKNLESNQKGSCTFEDNVLLVENSIQKESILDCQEFCQTIANCEVCIKLGKPSM